MPQLTSRPRAAYLPIAITERSLVDISDLLQADRFEVADTHVVFIRRRGATRSLRWAGHFGDHLLADGDGWRITSEIGFETTWASVA